MTLKEIRKTYRLTQKAAAKIVEVSLRTYAEYEKEVEKMLQNEGK